MKAKKEIVPVVQKTAKLFYFPVLRKAVPSMGCQKIRQLEDRGIF
jgi:hypothetical protein